MKDEQLTAKELSIPNSIVKLDDAILRSVESFEQLHTKIESVLGPLNPNKEVSNDRTEGDCGLAEKLNQFTDRVHSLRNLIESTSKRVEL